MDHYTYTPQMKDTEGINLPEGLLDLLEYLAEHTHDVWADQRIRDGWRYHPVHNVEDQRHDCLIPYSDLPEPQKEVDRRMAIETLKLIILLGYEIRPAQD
jgi:hypothetical protein